MLRLKNLTVKNFLSVGNVTQAVDFDRQDLTLVLGENLDLGNDGNRNGTGKTTIINALSYGLYGQALTNIKKDNLINKTNGKQLMVTIEFEKDNISYKIERGRKPNIMSFYVSGVEQEITDESQGDSRETQNQIEHIVGMSHDMFKHIVALNTYTEPFLSLRANEQRIIIEQLLGITVLSEKAEALKEQIRITKETISSEEVKIKAINDANNKVKEQINSLIRRQKLWLTKKNEDLDVLQKAYDELTKIDIEVELDNHKKLNEYNKKFSILKNLNLDLSRAIKDLNKDQSQLTKLVQEITSLENHTCHSCGQTFHDDKQKDLLNTKKQNLVDLQIQINQLIKNKDDLEKEIAQLGPLDLCPEVFYQNESDAFEHRSSMANILSQITSKQNEEDPYGDQISEMQEQAITKIDYDYINELSKLRDHQEFLLKLLTSKDSFIRKKIIDQNLNYLNIRLSYYLDKIGLPHVVKFNNDLSVSIEELGRELDFDNLSRGERNRLILSLSWAFRDVWESLYQKINLLFIDELVDSGMDSSGVENALAILKKMTRDSDRSVWLVSHKDELSSRVNNILTVIKENGFTNYHTDVDFV